MLGYHVSTTHMIGKSGNCQGRNLSGRPSTMLASLFLMPMFFACTKSYFTDFLCRKLPTEFHGFFIFFPFITKKVFNILG